MSTCEINHYHTKSNHCHKRHNFFLYDEHMVIKNGNAFNFKETNQIVHTT